jgi:uncharacterized protein
LSTAPVYWTLLFAGACALLQCALTALVIAQRVRTGIRFLDGGDPTLLRRTRAHGNFSETAPMALLLMLLLELSGVAWAWLVMLGTALLLGRLLHAAGLLGWGGHRARLLGMALTLAVVSLAGIGCVGIAIAKPMSAYVHLSKMTGSNLSLTPSGFTGLPSADGRA